MYTSIVTPSLTMFPGHVHGLGRRLNPPVQKHSPLVVAHSEVPALRGEVECRHVAEGGA